MQAASFGSDRRVDRVGHRDRIWKVESRQLGVLRAELGDDAVDIDQELAEWRNRSNLGCQVRFDDGVEAADIPPDELDRQVGGENDLNCVRVGPHVVFGNRIRVADVVGDGAHRNTPCESRGERRVFLERKRDVGQRAERDQREFARMVVRGLNQRLDSVALVRYPTRECEPVVAHPIVTMYVLSCPERQP